MVHVIIKSTGEWSDRSEITICAFTDLEKAKAYVEQADAEDRQQSEDMRRANERYDELSEEEQGKTEWPGWHDDATFYLRSVPLITDAQP